MVHGCRFVGKGRVRPRVIRQGISRSAVLYRYVAGLPTDGYQWAYGAGAGAGLIPTNDGQTCVFVSTTPERMRGLRRDGAAAGARGGH